MINDLEDHEQLEYFYDDLHQMGTQNSKEFVYNLSNPQKVIGEWFYDEKIELSDQPPKQDDPKLSRQVLDKDFLLNMDDKDKSLKSDTQSDDQFEIQPANNKQEEIKEQPQQPLKKNSNHTQNKQYSELVEIIDKMNEYSWIDSIGFQSKNAPIKQLTAISFWFMVSCQYFRKEYYKDKTPEQLYNELIEKLNLDHLDYSIRIDMEDQSFNFNPTQELQFNTEQDRDQRELVLASVNKRIIERAKEFTFKKGQFSETREIQKILNFKQEFDYEDCIFQLSIRQMIIKAWEDLKKDETLLACFLSETPQKESELIREYNDLFIEEEDEDREYKDDRELIEEKLEDIPENEEKLLEDKRGEEIQSEKEKYPYQADEDDVVEEIERPNQQEWKQMEAEQDQQDNPVIENNVTQNPVDGLLENQNENCEKSCQYFRSDKLIEYLLHADLDCIIEALQIELENAEEERIEQLNQLKERIEQSLDRENFFYNLLQHDGDEILQDLQGLTKDEKDYLNYLENRQQSGEHLKEIIKNSKKKINLSGTARYLSNSKMDDMVCQICNDGDYVEDNLIVFCSVNQIKQLNFEEMQYIGPLEIGFANYAHITGIKGGNISGILYARYLKCPLCTKRGGAMKQTNILMKESIFESMNPNFHQYAITHSQDHQEPLHEYELMNFFSANGERESYHEKLFYDFQLIQNNQIDNIPEEPTSKYVWVHLTCAYWLPECFFTRSKDKPSWIMGLQNIDKKRFNLVCHICKQKKQGACIQCSRGKCCTAFHPECARRAQFFMEPRPYPQSYLIFCEKHMPLKLKRILENRAKGFVEEIQQFCKSIEKNHSYIIQQMNRQQMSNCLTSDKKKRLELRAQQQEIEAEIKQENKAIIQDLREFLKQTDINKILINLRKERAKEFSVIDIKMPETSINEKLKSLMSIPKSDPIWNNFRFQNYNTEQTYKLYKRAVRMDKPTRPIKQKKIADYFDEDFTLRRRQSIEKRQQSQQQIVVTNKKKSKFSKIMKKIQKKIIQRPKRESLLKIKIPKHIATFMLSKKNKKNLLRKQQQQQQQQSQQQQQQHQQQPAIEIQKINIQPTTQPIQMANSLVQPLYCFCRQPFVEGEDMMQCEQCLEWYHLKCLGFSQGIEQANEINFYCFQCEKMVDSEKQRQIKQIYKHYFTDPTFKTLKNKLGKKKQLLQEKKLDSNKSDKQEKSTQLEKPVALEKQLSASKQKLVEKQNQVKTEKNSRSEKKTEEQFKEIQLSVELQKTENDRVHQTRVRQKLNYRSMKKEEYIEDNPIKKITSNVASSNVNIVKLEVKNNKLQSAVKMSTRKKVKKYK